MIVVPAFSLKKTRSEVLQKKYAFHKRNLSNFFIGLGSRYSKAVGKSISTKAVGKDERHDVTNLYKAPEGSEEERLAFQKAYGFGNIPEYQKGFLGVEKEGKGLTLGGLKKNATF